MSILFLRRSQEYETKRISGGWLSRVGCGCTLRVANRRLATHMPVLSECDIFFDREHWQANAEIAIAKAGPRFPKDIRRGIFATDGKS
jgi:hypothetical protein